MFHVLTALAVLAYASATMADNLPPVPKTIVGTVTAIVAEPKAEAKVEEKAEAKTEAKVEEKAERSFRLHEVKAPSACTPIAPMPPVPKSEAGYYDGPKPSVCGRPTAMPPAQGEVQKFCDATVCAKCQLKDQAKTCKHCVETSVKFVANELLLKPIYDVHKALNDLEGRRLTSEEQRLAKTADRLAKEGEALAQKAKGTCPHDLHAKLKLVKEEKELAGKANKLAVKKAALELKEAEHAEAKTKLDARHNKLYHAAD
jgi:hypothetical protein